MAQEYIRYRLNFDDEEEDKKSSPKVKEGAGTAVRTAGGLVVPTMIRLGTGFGSGMGGAAGFGISGAGEGLAQFIENGGDISKLNLKRILAEATIGAVPGAKIF